MRIFAAGVIALLESKYSAPSTIQSQAWPLALSGRDMVACAETGSGKTLGFILPALIHASQQSSFRNNSGPLAMVLCPTRELAQQVAAEAVPFCRVSRLNSDTRPIICSLLIVPVT